MAAPVAFEFCKAKEVFTEVLRVSANEDTLTKSVTVVENYSGSDGEKKSAFDQAFRDVLRELTVVSTGCASYKALITLAVEAVEKDLCSTNVPFLMLADVFDVIPLDQCQDVFDLVEDKVHTWKSEMFFEAGKNTLLRVCNDLLRRLSKSQNTVFCGRIQLFLSRLFPLSEKSALNLMSQFNLENVTVFNTHPEGLKDVVKQEKKDDSMEVEEGEMEDQSSVPIDYNLYKRFWSLQDYFRKPTQCYEKVNWKKFLANAEAVLAAFDSSKLDDLKSSRKRLQSRRMPQTDTFFAKYLTSEKLLNLQLNDSNFRRYVLVQFLILFQYLTAPVKFKNSSQTVTDEQGNWIRATQEKVFQLIRETPPDGEQFAKTVEHILSREENWNKWKNDGCTKYEREMSTDSPKQKPKAKRRRVGEDLQQSGGKVIKMGNAELTKLWNLNPDNMEACKSEKRIFLPSLEEFFADAIEQEDPEQMVEEEYKSINDQIFQWKALRLLARRSPLFFTHNTTPALPLNKYLSLMLSKLAKELPSQNSEDVKTELGEEEALKETQEEEELKQGEEQNMTKEERQESQDQAVLTGQAIQSVAEKLGADWKKLATELNFPEDDISYLESENAELSDRALKMLTLWQENEGDRATAGALKIALKEVGLAEIANVVLGAS